MKKTIYLIAMLFTTALISCTKSHTCECSTVTTSALSTSSETKTSYEINGDWHEAKEECESSSNCKLR